MAATAATVLSGAGALAGALGSGKGQTVQQSQSGFATLPKELQDYLKGDIFARIKAYGQTPYAKVPYQQYSDTDPIFSSQAMRNLQQRKNIEAIMAARAKDTAAPQATQSSNMSGDTASALEFLSRARSQYLPATRQSQMLNRISGEDDINSLAKLLGWYKSTTGHSASNLDGISRYAATDPEMLKIYQEMMS